MGRLIKFELRKLKNRKSIFISLGIVLAMLVGVTLILRFTLKETQTVEDLAKLLKNYAFGIVGGIFATLIAIFTALFVCEDYSAQIVKNIFSRGYGRSQVYFSKTILNLIAVTGMYIIFAAAWVVLSAAFCGSSLIFTADLPMTLLVGYLTLLCYSAVSLMFSAVLRKTAGAVALGIFAPEIIETVLTIITLALNSSGIRVNVINYWFTSFLSNSLLQEVEEFFLGAGLEAWLKTVLATAYTTVFVILGWLGSRKAQS